MTRKFPASFLWLALYCICTEISLIVTYSDKCIDYLDPFKCQIKPRNCFVKAKGEPESDCRDKQWKVRNGVKFEYDITFKKQGVKKVCEGCCCDPISSDLKFFNNSCSNCLQIWSTPQKIGNFTLSGNIDVMTQALKNKKFLSIRKDSILPSSVILYPDIIKTRCKLDASVNGTWKIVVASNSKWKNYFEESIINGFIVVKSPKDQLNMQLAIQQKRPDNIRLHFLNVSVQRNTQNSKFDLCLKPEKEKEEKKNEKEESNRTELEPTEKFSTPKQSITEMSRTTNLDFNFTSADQSMYFSTVYFSQSTKPFSSKKSEDFSSTTFPEDEILTPLDFQDNLKNQLNKVGNETEKRIKTVANFVEKHKSLKEENLFEAVKELNNVNQENEINSNVTKDFVNIVNGLVSPVNTESWKNLSQKTVDPSTVMNATDVFLKRATKHVKGEKQIKKRNLILHYGRIPKKKAQIFNSYQISLKTKIYIPQQVFQTTTSAKIRYSFIFYKSFSFVMKNVATFRSGSDLQSNQLNSPILSISLYPRLKVPLRQNIRFTLEHYKPSKSKLKCAFWNFSYRSQMTGFYGRWETEGCQVIKQNQTCTTCSCNHLTNFALLMSPHPKVIINSLMTTLSLVSGSISSLSLLCTIICYAVLWPNLTQSPVNRSRAIILMNLCIALLTANIIFLIGSRSTGNKVVCKLISVLLHFFYLVVFFSMLMEGIDMLVTVIMVFGKRIRAKWLIAGTWGFPFLIVSISFPIKFKDYTDLHYCWLSIKDGLRWAFIGPAFFVMFVNFFILIIVISRMMKTQEMMQKSIRKRLRTGIRGVILLSPILGFTWIIGFFLIQKNDASQYAFIVFHTLQGLFIFLLHCIFSRQVREGFCQWLQKKSYFHNLSNSTLRCAVLDQTNVTRTISSAQSTDELDSYPQKLSEFQSRKSFDFLIPSK